MQVSLLTGAPKKGFTKDVGYGCWCGGNRIAGAECPRIDLVSIATLLKKNRQPVTSLGENICE